MGSSSKNKIVIDDWRDAWRFLSVNVPVVLGVLAPVAYGLSPHLLLIGEHVPWWVYVSLSCAVSVILRMVKQR